MYKRRLYGLIFLIILSVFSYGCTPPPPPPPLLSWPDPPDELKIGYVGMLTGENDFRTAGFLDAIIGVSSGTGLVRPYGVVSQGDRIYVADTNGGLVMVFDEKTRKVSYLGDKGKEKLLMPIGIAAGPDGAIYVSDVKAKLIQVYDQTGKLKMTIGGKKDAFQNPAGLAINAKLGRIYVADSQAHAIKAFTLKGEYLFEFGKRGSGDGEFNFPSNIAINRSTGVVYVSDTQNFRVQAFDQDGKFLSTFGDLGDGPGKFARPKGIGVDTDGHIYIDDAAFANFQIFDEMGQILLVIGGPSSEGEPGTFLSPAGLYVDEKDRIYVTDAVTRSVQIFQYMSDAWKRAHPEEYKKYLTKAEEKKQ